MCRPSNNIILTGHKVSYKQTLLLLEVCVMRLQVQCVPKGAMYHVLHTKALLNLDQPEDCFHLL